MARRKNDFPYFNGAWSLPPAAPARPDWFALVYFPVLFNLYLVLTRVARLDPNAARVKVREAAKAMLVKRRYEWKVWKQSELLLSRSRMVRPRSPPSVWSGLLG
jgi:hypothetical protein